MTTEERLKHLERELVRVKRCDRWLMLVAACLGMVFAWVFLARSGRLGTSRSEGPAAATQPGTSGSLPAAESLAGPGPATAPVPREIRAGRFVLEDDQGKTRALLAMDKWGPSLLLVDANENPRVALDASRNGPGLMLYDRLGKGGVALGQDDDDGPAMRLLDENGKVRAALAMPGGTPGLVLVDENDKTQALLAVGGGTPSLTLSDENEPRIVLGVQKSVPRLFLFDRGGKGGVTLGAGDEDGSGMSLVDENGNRRAGLGMFDGRPSLFMSDANDKPRVGLGLSRSGPGLMLFDKTGNGRALLSVDDQDGAGLFFSDENQQAVWQAP